MFFRKKRKPYKLEEVTIIETEQPTPVIKWVNMLLLHIHQNSVTCFILQKSTGVPLLPFDCETSKDKITIPKIINRLKVMSELGPGACEESKESSISLCICGKDYTAKLLFIDTFTDQSCKIDLVEV